MEIVLYIGMYKGHFAYFCVNRLPKSIHFRAVCHEKINSLLSTYSFHYDGMQHIGQQSIH